MFCGYVLIWYLQIGNRIPFLGSIRFEFIYAGVLSVLAIFSNKLKGTTNPLSKYIVILFLCMIIQIPFSYDLDTSWNVFIDKIIKFAVMAMLIVAFVKSPRDLSFFLAAFLLACLKMGQEGLIGTITGSMVWENQGVLRLHGSTGLYSHPNSFSGMALGTLPFVYFLAPISPLWIRVALFIQLGFALNIILFTGSRTGYMAFIVFILYAVYWSKKRAKAILYLLIVVAVALPFIPTGYIDRFHSIFTLEEKEGQSSLRRIEILEDAWQILIQHPFGVGISAFPAVRTATFGPDRYQDTHNLYLEVATNLGLQGLVIFFVFIYQLLKMLRNIQSSSQAQLNQLNNFMENFTGSRNYSRKFERHLFDLKLIKATSSAVSMFIFIRLALGLFGMDLYEIYWWFSLGLAICMYNINRFAKIKTDRYCGNV